jgi:hypothetical protein
LYGAAFHQQVDLLRPSTATEGIVPDIQIGEAVPRKAAQTILDIPGISAMTGRIRWVSNAEHGIIYNLMQEHEIKSNIVM